MIALLELIAVLLILLLIAQFLFGFGLFAGRQTALPQKEDGRLGSAAAQHAAAALRDLAEAQNALKSRYPTVFGMLSGYLNAHSIETSGGIEAAVKQMIGDWSARRDQAKEELVRLLAENDSEEEARAIVLSACDATFEQEGYRNWLIWLLGRFNAL